MSNTESEDLVAEYADLCDRQSAILRRVANALNGPPPPLTSWSHHDLGEKAEALKAEVERSKPRTITTEEELDALPVGTVVLSDTYRHYVDGWQVAFQRWSDGEWHRGARAVCTHPDNFLPATVLHEGATE